MIQVRSVNLAEIAQAFAGEAKIESNYKRLQRLMRGFALDFGTVAQFITKLLPPMKLRLTLDRTNWKLGLKDINLLVVGVVYRGASFPLMWKSLPKQGNSSTAERMALMERFISLLGLEKVFCLVADREFIGAKWFSYLIKETILFRIRIKNDTRVSTRRGKPVPVRNLFRDLRPGTYKILNGKRRIWGLEL